MHLTLFFEIMDEEPPELLVTNFETLPNENDPFGRFSSDDKTEDKAPIVTTLHRRPAVRKKVSTETYGEPRFMDEQPEHLDLSQSMKELKLHYPENSELLKYIKGRNFDLVQRDHNGYTPLHAIVSSSRCDRIECLLILMVHSEYGTVLIDMLGGKNNQTALHIAVQLRNIEIVKILLAFGADINAFDGLNRTPLDTISTKETELSHEAILSLLKSLDAKSYQSIKKSVQLGQRSRLWSISSHSSLNKEDKCKKTGQALGGRHFALEEYMSDLEISQKLEKYLSAQFATYSDIWDHHFQFALGLQQFELQGWKTTCNPAIRFQVQGGSRILFLDGGGMRGLIQIEILAMLEKCTGRQTIDLFDWIIGTSTGGIVALGLVYGKKTLAELRQVYFKLKEDIFSKTGFGIGYNTEALELILKENFDSNIRMSDIKEPKVLISAVMKKTTNLNLTFFNNCFNDEFSNELVWKVARYTSAAPMNFSECDGYVDGGVLANNPSEYGLTAIQNYHRSEGIKLNLCCVVSIGTGKFPAAILGSTDAHEGIFHLLSLKKKASNLMTLITKALVESEDVADNSRSRCKEQQIPFYRFSPRLDVEVQSGETNVDVLLEMLMKTKFQIADEWRNEIKDLTLLFSRMETYDEQKRQQRLKDRRQRHAFRFKENDENELFD
ncbi:PREDICTED: 85/88 kDa calcium-independent phospholipase A2-like isoform X2 [Amphimedon queenslandica]|uniref:phospholipase A2 n=1 Tax=Amphimedon queenslandica TaxID=400682 RepID=A0AAN0J7E9_AMPQE|nr:PREDICTED: 85/88 kDa calcium-independent phospholipase A2-like isoform X2 [Amphimedon queenslandica]|eukprot:XP_019852623.1 PREDICTED: 85/88 kDa calcium-independent phospholipase A2-like isoform X2 [Amphimedon queenslandica]